jgi:hypothetical protein
MTITQLILGVPQPAQAGDYYRFRLPGGTVVRVTRRSDDWHCCREGNPAEWGCGRTVSAAIGNYIMAHLIQQVVEEPNGG